MDVPSRANAAQMALRNIKSAKGKHLRRTGPTLTDNSSRQPWPAPSSENGLFGGGVQASGTFDFAAPSSFKFNSSSFSSMPTTISDEPENTNSRFIGDDRSVKRLFGQSATPAENSAPPISNIFSACQTLPNFSSGGAQNLSLNSNSSFQGESTHGSFNGGIGTPANAPIFSFGLTSLPTSSNITFGSTMTKSSGESIFKSGNQNTSQLTPSSPFNFGAPLSQAQPLVVQSTFGQTSTDHQSNDSVLRSETGTLEPNISIFGGQTTSPSKSSNFSNIFGDSKTIQPQGSIFKPVSSNLGMTDNSNISPSNCSGTWEALSSTNSNDTSTTFLALETNNVNGDLKQNLPSDNAPIPTKDQEVIKPMNSFFTPLSGTLTQQSSKTNLFAHLKSQSSNLPKVSSPLKKFSQLPPHDSSISNSDNIDKKYDQNSETPPHSQNFGTQSFIDKSNINNNTLKSMNKFQSNQSLQQSANLANSHSLTKRILHQTSPQNAFIAKGDNLQEFKGNEATANANCTELTNKTSGYPLFQINRNETTLNGFEKISTAEFPNPDKVDLPHNIFDQANLLSATSKSLTTESSILPSHADVSLEKSKDAIISPINVAACEKSTETINQPELLSTPIECKSGSETKRNKFAPEVLPQHGSFRELALVSQIKEDDIPDAIPFESDEVDRQQFCATYRLRALNQAMAKMFMDLPIYSDPQPALNFFTEERRIILEECSNFSAKTKRKYDHDQSEETNLWKKRKQTGFNDHANVSEATVVEATNPTRKRKLVEDNEHESQSTDKRNKNSETLSSKEKYDCSRSDNQVENENGIKSKDCEAKSTKINDPIDTKLTENEVDDIDPMKSGENTLLAKAMPNAHPTKQSSNLINPFSGSTKPSTSIFGGNSSMEHNLWAGSAKPSNNLGDVFKRKSLTEKIEDLGSGNDSESEASKHNKSLNSKLDRQTGDDETTAPNKVVSSVFDFNFKSGAKADENQNQTSPKIDNSSSKPISIFDRVTTVSTNDKPSIDSDRDSQKQAESIFSKSHFNPSLHNSKTFPFDKTWKPDTPIRFGAATTPSIFSSHSVNSHNSSKNASPADRDTTEIEDQGDKSNHSLQNPFAKNISTLPSNSITTSLDSAKEQSIFKTENSTKASFTSLFSNSSSANLTSVNKDFALEKSSEQSSLFSSSRTSSEISHNTISDPETIEVIKSGEGKDSDASEREQNEQINLTASGPGEENEDIIHEVRVKALKFVPKEGEGSKQWEIKGIGPLRILKRKDNGVSRLLLRGDPSGKVILNKALLGNVDYRSSGKTLKFLSASDIGNGIETWILQTKTEESSKKLAIVMEEQKPAS